MNQTLPILSATLAVTILAAVAVNRSPQGVDEKELTEYGSISDPPESGREMESPPDGGKLVDQAARQLLALPGIQAKTRQRVNVYGQHLVGSGDYLQWVQGPQLLLRLDLKLQIGQQVTSLQQISDGQILWIRTDLPHRKSLARVNLQRVRSVASQLPTPPSPTYWMALGGMPKLLARLSEQFVFEPAQPKVIGHLPVWKIDGHWKPDILAQLMPDDGDTFRPEDREPLLKLPEPLPHGVTLILGRDRVIPLFPYSISYFRYQPRDEEQADATPLPRVPIATLELFEVRLRPDLSPEDFDYRPGSQEVQDQTSQFIARLKAASQPPAVNR